MDDQAIKQIGRFVDRHHHAVAAGFGEGADAFLRRAGNDVLLLELAAGLEEDQRDLEREVVLQIGADLLVSAFGVARDPLQVHFELGIVVDLEVLGLVGVPHEVVVADLILAEVGNVAGLRQRKAGRASQRQQ